MRPLPALFSAAAAALAVGWLLQESDVAAPPMSGDTVGSPPAPVTSHASPAAATTGSAAPDASALPAPERTSGVEPLGRDGPNVLVQRASGAPAPFAEVYFLTRDAYQRRRGDDARLRPWDAAERFGRRDRADSAGRCALPAHASDDEYYVAASHQGEFGYAAIKGAGSHPLRMSVDESVALEAAFSDGEPAAVPVALLQQTSANRSMMLWQGETARDGRARVAHFQLLRRSSAAAGRASAADADTPARFAALLRIPTAPLTLVEFPGQPAPDAPVHLEVPDLGSIQVELVCHSGLPLLSPARVGFVTERRSRQAGAFPVSRRALYQSTQKALGALPVTLPHAQVAREAQIYVRYPYERRASYAPNSMGPAARGELATLRISPSSKHAVVAGRLLRPDGRPCGDAAGELRFWRSDQVQATAEFRTLADGSWDCVLIGHAEDADWRVEIRTRPPTEPASETRTERSLQVDEVASLVDVPAAMNSKRMGTSVALRAWPGGERTDLGDVKIAPLPALCAGVVVDGAGEGIAGAQVSVERLSGDKRWQRLRGLVARTDTSGAFRIEAEMPPGALYVRADTDRHFRASVPLLRPNEGLKIRLLENGVLTGEVKLPAWLPDRSVTLTLQPREPGRRDLDTRSERVSARRGGEFRIDPLRVGRYDLLVRMRGLSAPLATIEGVLINTGENRDARLAPLDLTGALHRFQMRALDQGGRPLDLDGPIHAKLQGLDGTWSEAGFRWLDGRAELITAHTTAELTFFGRGFAPQRQRYQPGAHDVYLETLQPALVMVSGARALAGEGRKVRISAILKGDTGYPSSLSGTDQKTGRRFSFPRWDLGRSSGGWLGATDLVEIPLMQAGEYELLFRAHADETTRTPQTQVSLGVFELTPGGAETTSVPVPAQAVVEAMAQLDLQWRARQEQRGK